MNPFALTIKASPPQCVKAGALVQPRRVACTDKLVGPSLYHLLEVLGRGCEAIGKRSLSAGGALDGSPGRKPRVEVSNLVQPRQGRQNVLSPRGGSTDFDRHPPGLRPGLPSDGPPGLTNSGARDPAPPHSPVEPVD